MIETKTIQYTKEVDVKKICDRCGRVALSDTNYFVEWQEFAHFYFCGGYGAIMGDSVELECDLCQHCIQQLLGGYLREVKRDNDEVCS